MRLLYFLFCLIPLINFAQQSRSANPQPNIVIFLSDDQGWGDLSINGNRNLNTPNIDRIGRNGAQFRRFYVQPVCSPTRAELLTGRYHPRSGVFSTSEGGERIDLSETTLADVFQKAGYATGAFGKWHSGMQYPYHPNGRGFTEFYGFCSGHWGDYFSPPLERNGQVVQGKGFTADDFTDHAIAFIEQNRNRPFLAYVPFNTPHSPMQVPDRWWQPFANKPLPMRATNPAKEDTTFTRAALAMCENIDWNVGRVMEKLRQLNLTENTIVLYFNDNGPNAIRWNGNMKGIKGSTDEGGVRSPLLIQYPKAIRAGAVIDPIAGAIDLLPTLTDLAGISYQPPKPLDGISLKPLLTGTTRTGTDRLIFAHWGGRVSARSDRYRLDHTGKLFDMLTDSTQSTDVSASQSDALSRLRKAVDAWKADVLAGYSPTHTKPFTVGHPAHQYTQLPARDGHPVGGIKRSNQHPNSTYFTNWKTPGDAIMWDVNVLEAGDFEAELYYACPAADLGSTVRLSLGEHSTTARVTVAHNPPLRGMEHDRVPRIESYVKDFKPMPLGRIHLPKGVGKLTLNALNIPHSQVMEVRQLVLKRVH